MLRLKKPKSGKRIEFGAGASITYREATAIDNEAGQAAAREFFRKARDGKAALAEYGLDVGDMPALDADPALSAGVSTVVSLAEIGIRCISAWEGIADEDGKPLELNRANLCALFADPALFSHVQSALLARLFEIVAEGNGLEPSPNGAPAAG